jgi:hypothetical protein
LSFPAFFAFFGLFGLSKRQKRHEKVRTLFLMTQACKQAGFASAKAGHSVSSTD